ncbi:MAG TPA: S-layer homology domain-containing protein [Clostridiaceae bacterium]|nr:S-layer homology domain-containing protein [Clostridiaceae bacterium]
MVKTLGLNVDFEDNFDDVNVDDYYYEAIGIAKKLGIVLGQDNNLFKPRATISRQDMMVMVERALRRLNIVSKTSTITEINKFSDKYQIAEYAKESIEALVKAGLIQGDGTRINPLANTTRAETAVFLYRIYNKYWIEN